MLSREVLQLVASACWLLAVCGWFMLRRRTRESRTWFLVLTDRAGTLRENSRSRSHPTLVLCWALKQQLFLGSRNTFSANQASKPLGPMHPCSPHFPRPTTADVRIVPSPWLVDRWPAGLASGCLCSAAQSASAILSGSRRYRPRYR